MSIAAVEKWEAKQREIGRQAGIQEGRQAGIQEGRQLIILNMLRDDIPMEVIVRLTGVSEEKIEAIRKEIDDMLLKSEVFITKKRCYTNVNVIITKGK